MQGLGIIMMLAFFHLFFVPWKGSAARSKRRTGPRRGAQLTPDVRHICAVRHLVLGLIVAAIWRKRAVLGLTVRNPTVALPTLKA